MLNSYRKMPQISEFTKQRSKTNLLIFIIITLASGWIGVLADRILTEQPEGYSTGTGIWLALPLLCAIIFRIREKEWKSFGIALNIKTAWRGYVAAILTYPAITFITVSLAVCFGYIGTSMISWTAVISAALTAFAGNFIKNIFEEFAWRGYLTPRLLECNLNDWLIYGISGLVWGLWHTAYYMVFLGDEYFLTSSRLETLMVGCFVTVIGSILFVEIYRLTKSVWPCVILHSVQNSISTALAVTGASVQYEGGAEVVFDPVTGILSIIILVGVGLLIRKKRIALDNHPIPH